MTHPLDTKALEAAALEARRWDGQADPEGTARAIVSAYLAAEKAAGRVMMPRYATDAMAETGMRERMLQDDVGRKNTALIWRAMIDAALTAQEKK